MNDHHNNPLELLTVDEIVDELGRRFPSVVVVAHGVAKQRDRTITITQFRGSTMTCLGLAVHAQASLCRTIDGGGLT